MKTAIRWASMLSALAFLAANSPALAKPGNGNSQGKGNAYGQSKGNSQGNGHAYGHSKDGGSAKGSPAPIAGLGILALGAIGYGTRRLQKNKQK
jgi:hypothetical protein